MRCNKCYTTILLVGLVLMNGIMPSLLHAQESLVVMTLADGTNVNVTSDQLAALKAQPGIVTAANTTGMTATQMAVPLPAALGGSFLIAEPAALAAGMNAVGITSGITAASFAGATVATGAITVGAAAGGAIAGGIAGGTVALGAAAAAAAVAGIAAATGGGGSSETPAVHHSTTVHH